jgi:hypothetical protein
MFQSNNRHDRRGEWREVVILAVALSTRPLRKKILVQKQIFGTRSFSTRGYDGSNIFLASFRGSEFRPAGGRKKSL